MKLAERNVVSGFSKPQKRELGKLLNLIIGGEKNCIISSFILNFIRLEAIARKILHFYRCRKSAKTELTGAIDISQIHKSIEYFEINFDVFNLQLILDSKLRTRNSKSCRNLRNGIFHRLQSKDIKEVNNRYNELTELFCSFFEAVRAKVYE